jgi:hypothetical protein
VEMTLCKQSSSSPLILFISLLVIRVYLIRITDVISYQFMLQLYCFQIHRSYLLESELSLRVIIRVDYQL